MTYEETRRRLLGAMPKGGATAEVGVWKGDYSAEILLHAQPRVLHLIDPWLSREDPSHATAMYGAARGADLEAIYTSVCARFAEEVASGLVVIHRKPSAEALAVLPDDSLDWVYIDGDHAFEAVRQDLELSMQKVRPGGFICLDDHYVGKWWRDGIVRAVNTFLGAHPDGLELKFCADTQVVIAKR